MSKGEGGYYNDFKRLDHLASYGEVEDHVTLKLHNMQYACGECLELYRVDKIIASENGEHDYYFNKEISITFLNKNKEGEFYAFSCKNGQSYFVLSGYFRRNALGNGRLDVTDGEFVCN